MTITADFSGGEKTATTEPLYQWDTGQKLALSGLPATSTDIQVHFANAAMAQAIVKATAIENSLPTCDIPNEFLQYGSAAKARAWVFYRTSNTEGYTVRTVLIPVTPRKRPNDYVSPEDPDSKGIVERVIELLEHYQSDLNAKEEKSNKKATLTGNELSNDFYPTTKAVADALNTKAPLSTAFTIDSTTTTVVYSADNPKKIYTNAVVNDKNAFVLTTANNYYQIALCYDGTEYKRELTAGGAVTYTAWAVVNNESGSATEKETVDLSPYLFPTYTQGTLDGQGEIVEGIGYVTNFLPVVPLETILLNNKLTTCVCYYDIDEVFISKVTMTAGMNEYTVPENAKLARYQNVYAGGEVIPFNIRLKDLTKFNKSFYEVIMSPHYSQPYIQFAGDSNTVGYGLAAGDKSWADLLSDILTGLTSASYQCFGSKYVNSIGAHEYSGGYNFQANSFTELYTNANSVTLFLLSNYDSTWKWYIDGQEATGFDSQTILSGLDGNHHTIRVVFLSGQAVEPEFIISKEITCTNNAVTGTDIGNVIIQDGFDWTLLMIGTNNRHTDSIRAGARFYKVNGKATYIYPFPNHKTHQSYTHDQLYTYSLIADMLKNYGFEILNCSDIAGSVFIDNTYYQSDLIHFNANGHKIICNIVSGALGMPAYLTIT